MEGGGGGGGTAATATSMDRDAIVRSAGKIGRSALGIVGRERMSRRAAAGHLCPPFPRPSPLTPTPPPRPLFAALSFAPLASLGGRLFSRSTPVDRRIKEDAPVDSPGFKAPSVYPRETFTERRRRRRGKEGGKERERERERGRQRGNRERELS